MQAARRLGVEPEYIYRHVFTGFAARFPASGLRAARAGGRVRSIRPDRPVTIAAQIIPAGVERIDAASEWAGDSVEIDVGVAVIDTGIQREQARKGTKDKHSADLRVAGGKSCINRDTPFRDENGHGTHVAGTVGTRDNGYGVAGVAPGVRLYAVKVLTDGGSGSDATIICGLDWVVGQGGEINVVNLSLGGLDIYGDNSCTEARGANGDPLYAAICDTVAAGVAVVVASGNDGEEAAGSSPVRYDVAITVAAFADFDGVAGGEGGRCARRADDTYASFSTYGAVVDLAAPGVCVRSTKADGHTVVDSGTHGGAPWRRRPGPVRRRPPRAPRSAPPAPGC